MVIVWFDKSSVPLRGGYAITILRNGIINISQKLYDDKFADAGYAQLGYDKEQQVIAIRPVPNDEDGAYCIRTVNGKAPNICGVAFLTTYGIPHPQTKRYKVEWEDDMALAEIKDDRSSE